MSQNYASEFLGGLRCTRINWNHVAMKNQKCLSDEVDGGGMMVRYCCELDCWIYHAFIYFHDGIWRHKDDTPVDNTVEYVAWIAVAEGMIRDMIRIQQNICNPTRCTCGVRLNQWMKLNVIVDPSYCYLCKFIIKTFSY